MGRGQEVPAEARGHADVVLVDEGTVAVVCLAVRILPASVETGGTGHAAEGQSAQTHGDSVHGDDSDV